MRTRRSFSARLIARKPPFSKWVKVCKRSAKVLLAQQSRTMTTIGQRPGTGMFFSLLPCSHGEMWMLTDLWLLKIIAKSQVSYRKSRNFESQHLIEAVNNKQCTLPVLPCFRSDSCVLQFLEVLLLTPILASSSQRIEASFMMWCKALGKWPPQKRTKLESPWPCERDFYVGLASLLHCLKLHMWKKNIIASGIELPAT